jgi:ribosomal protein S18 acetylase RimI-like enzyme
MRRSLRGPIDEPVWPGDVTLEVFSGSRAAEVHALLELAYANGGGSVASFDEWWPGLVGDKEYDPNLVFPACDAAGIIVGVAQCWTSAFVKDLVIHPGFRRRGLGRALLLHVFHVFRERGDEAVELKVRTDNPSGALHFYENLGMAIVPN